MASETNTHEWQKVWPDWVRNEFDIKRPISEYLRDVAENDPDKTAIDFYGRTLSYQELNDKIDRFAWGLVGLGLQRGDRVGLQLPNCPQFVICYFGILRAGGVVVAMNPMFKSAEIEYEVGDATPKIFICSDWLYKYVAAISNRDVISHVITVDLNSYVPERPSYPLPKEAESASEDVTGTLLFDEIIHTSKSSSICRVVDLKKDLALLQYTGGTTGMPKGAMISHYGLAVSAKAVANWFRISPDDTCVGVAPFFHIMGMIPGMASIFATGAKHVVLSRFVPNTVATVLEKHRCTVWHTSTTMLIALLQTPDIEKFDFTSLRLVANGGALISVEVLKRFHRLMPQAEMVDGYGLTECISHGGACTPVGGYRPGRVGVPHMNVMRIVDASTGTTEMPRGEQGEIVLLGPCIMKGYWQRPEETKKAFKDGWFYTGDIGAMDEEGYLTLLGRNKDLIKCSGFSVFPDEVENLMYRHDAVAEVAVVGVADSYRGESAKAFVVLKPSFNGDVSEEDVRIWCKENMAAYKCPKEIVFTESLPKSAAGKVLRRLLKEIQ